MTVARIVGGLARTISRVVGKTLVVDDRPAPVRLQQLVDWCGAQQCH